MQLARRILVAHFDAQGRGRVEAVGLQRADDAQHAVIRLHRLAFQRAGHFGFAAVLRQPPDVRRAGDSELSALKLHGVGLKPPRHVGFARRLPDRGVQSGPVRDVERAAAVGDANPRMARRFGFARQGEFARTHVEGA